MDLPLGLHTYIRWRCRKTAMFHINFHLSRECAALISFLFFFISYRVEQREEAGRHTPGADSNHGHCSFTTRLIYMKLCEVKKEFGGRRPNEIEIKIPLNKKLCRSLRWVHRTSSKLIFHLFFRLHLFCSTWLSSVRVRSSTLVSFLRRPLNRLFNFFAWFSAATKCPRPKTPNSTQHTHNSRDAPWPFQRIIRLQFTFMICRCEFLRLYYARRLLLCELLEATETSTIDTFGVCVFVCVCVVYQRSLLWSHRLPCLFFSRQSLARTHLRFARAFA